MRLEVALRPGCVYGGARLVSNSLSTRWFEITIWGGAIGTGRADGIRVSVMPSFAGAATCRESPERASEGGGTNGVRASGARTPGVKQFEHGAVALAGLRAPDSPNPSANFAGVSQEGT
jgi:hypothetical protein